MQARSRAVADAVRAGIPGRARRPVHVVLAGGGAAVAVRGVAVVALLARLDDVVPAQTVEVPREVEAGRLPVARDHDLLIALEDDGAGRGAYVRLRPAVAAEAGVERPIGVQPERGEAAGARSPGTDDLPVGAERHPVRRAAEESPLPAAPERRVEGAAGVE